MRCRSLVVPMILLPAVLAAQAAAGHPSPDPVVLQFSRFADIFGSRLVAAFDSIPADKYGYRPTPKQQSVGYIAQHLEDANRSLCERFGDLVYARTAKDSLADTIKAHWPKDTLVRRLERSLRFCDSAIERVPRLETASLASSLLAFETDLAEHYSQISAYMRLLGLTPPSALPPQQRKAITVSAAVLSSYVGLYQLAPGTEFDVTLNDGALLIGSTINGSAVMLEPESNTNFFAKGVDAQITFTRDASGNVTALVLHQYGRDRIAKKVR